MLVLLVIDGFDGSGFSGFSFLVLLVLALLVLGGGFSGFSFLALLVLLPKAIGIFEDNDTIFRFLSFSLFSILNQSRKKNQQRCKSSRHNTNKQQTPTFLSGAGIALTSPFIPTLQEIYIIPAITITTNNIQQKAAENPRSALSRGCYDARKVVVFFWRME